MPYDFESISIASRPYWQQKSNFTLFLLVLKEFDPLVGYPTKQHFLLNENNLSLTANQQDASTYLTIYEDGQLLIDLIQNLWLWSSRRRAGFSVVGLSAAVAHMSIIVGWCFC
jgi:hypothetical protein